MNVKEFVMYHTASFAEYEREKYAFRLLRNIMVHEIIGISPVSTLLSHAWDYRKQYTVDFINNYYKLHNKLPRHRHNVGNSFFPAVSSYVDFTALRQQIFIDCQNKTMADYPLWVQNET